MNEYNDLLNKGFEEGYAIAYEYEKGDFIVADNLAVSHRASPAALSTPEEAGLRILHRITVKAPQELLPGFDLPRFMKIRSSERPFGADEDAVWKRGRVGFRWDDDIVLKNH